MIEMPKPKYVCTDSWNIPVVGQEDYDALRAHAESLQAQRDKAIAFLHVYRNDTPLGNQPHMIAEDVDQFLKECGK